MVRFHDNPEKYNSSKMLLQLDQEVGNLRLSLCFPKILKIKEMYSQQI